MLLFPQRALSFQHFWAKDGFGSVQGGVGIVQ